MKLLKTCHDEIMACCSACGWRWTKQRRKPPPPCTANRQLAHCPQPISSTTTFDAVSARHQELIAEAANEFVLYGTGNRRCLRCRQGCIGWNGAWWWEVSCRCHGGEGSWGGELKQHISSYPLPQLISHIYIHTYAYTYTHLHMRAHTHTHNLPLPFLQLQD